MKQPWSGLILLATLTSGLGVPDALARPASGKALAGRAREVLRKHCLSCHGGGKDVQAGLDILDHEVLVQSRKVVIPGAPDHSELLDLVEGGSMPPGTHPRVPRAERAILRDWIQAGAPPFPSESGEEYIVRKILDDLRGLPARDRPHVRYLTLAPLAGSGKPTRAEQLAALKRTLDHLAPAGRTPPPPTAIEPTGAVVRIDLRERGWDRQPLHWEQAKAKSKSRLDLFDLVLLEYPYAILPTASSDFPELSRFLRGADQVRPVPYVRADWFIRTVLQTPLHRELLVLLGKSPTSPPPGIPAAHFPAAELTLADAVAELDVPQAELLRALELPRFARLFSLTREGKVDRALWERWFSPLAAHLRRGLPIVPVDGLTCADHSATPRPLVELKAVDYKDRRRLDPPARTTFFPGDRMVLWVKANADVVIELVYTSAAGTKDILTQGDTHELAAGKPRPFAPADTESYTIGPDPGVDRVTVYAYPRAALRDAKATFQAGRLLRAPGVHDRVVHPLYRLTADGKGLEPPPPELLEKVTVSLTIRARP